VWLSAVGVPKRIIEMAPSGDRGFTAFGAGAFDFPRWTLAVRLDLARGRTPHLADRHRPRAQSAGTA